MLLALHQIIKLKIMKKILLYIAALALTVVACDKNETPSPKPGKKELSDEWYAGGRLGTAFNSSASAYEQPTPAVENADMVQAFKNGEQFFERDYNQNKTGAFKGLGPLMGFEVIIVNGIEESGSVDADCGFEANADIAVVNSRGFTVLRHLKRDIVGILRNGNFRIYECICFSVREFVAPFVSILRPFNHNLALVNRSLERLYGKGLRHTGQRT